MIGVVDSFGVLNANGSSGTFPQIVDGIMGTNMPAIRFSHLIANASGVTMSVAFTPASAIPSGSSVFITIAGSAPQSLSASTVVFTSPSSGASASANLVDGVLPILLSSGTFPIAQTSSFLLRRVSGYIANIQFGDFRVLKYHVFVQFSEQPQQYTAETELHFGCNSQRWRIHFRQIQ